jgi:hypothetical protein
MPNSPKPTVGYIAVSPDWDPAAHPTHAWNPHATARQARESLAFAELVGNRKVILKMETTYTFVESCDHD